MIIDVHLWIAVQLPVVEDDFSDKLTDVTPCDCQTAVLGFGLAEFQDLVDQIAQPYGTFIDYLHFPPAGRCQTAVCGKVLQRTQDERKGSAQLMGDVGEKSQAFLVQFLFLQILTPSQFQRVLQSQMPTVASEEMPYCANSQQSINHPRPPGTPEGRRYDDVEQRLLPRIPVLAFQLGF